MRDRPVTILLLESLSYTGTTWLNLILGSHDDVLALGPADRIKRLKSGDEACLLHGKDCPFWPSFFENYDPEENLFLQLADFSGKDYIVTNNLSPDGFAGHLRHPDIIVRRIRVVRDGRAIFSSWLRNHPERTTEEGIETFLAPGMLSQSSLVDPKDPGVLFCRYEDVLRDKKKWISRFARFTGVDYGENSLKYWEYDLHPISGNQGTISLLKFAQGIPVPEGYRDKEFYEEQFRRSTNDEEFQSNRWEEELSMEQRLLVDLTCGRFQEQLGYLRDSFDLPFVSQQIHQIVEKSPKGSYIARAAAAFVNGEGDEVVKPQVHSGGFGLRVLRRVRKYVPKRVEDLMSIRVKRGLIRILRNQ